ncbi:MAG: hypothetical protein E7011_04240 [Alphaproteobacteria bacterium]|nr:hypothetical protein [Alphaproteobacteria bacterium]
MKTKIIYISGNEVFEMTQIRAAFDEVRSALRLDKDTILFGVPVDNDCAIDVPEVQSTVQNTAPCVTEAIVEDIQTTVNEELDIINCDADTTVDDTESNTDDDVPETIISEQPNITDSDIKQDAPAEPADKVIPILSILSVQDDEVSQQEPSSTDVSTDKETGEDSVNETEQVATVDVKPETDTDKNVQTEVRDDVQIFDLNIDTQLIPAETDDDTITDAQPVTIGDMISDEAPEMPVEKTLEQLLESMKPLREDLHDTVNADDENVISDPIISPDDVTPFLGDDTDETLAKLASEFAQKQDKIVTETKSESHGKIGKLKHILPFSKQKRDDAGMGGLFSWAGIAANDDEISIPEFFPTKPSNKQDI